MNGSSDICRFRGRHFINAISQVLAQSCTCLLVVAVSWSLGAAPISRARADDPGQSGNSAVGPSARAAPLAVAEAVRFLKAHQKADGSFLEPKAGAHPEIATSLLVGLALHCADASDEGDHVAKAAGFVFDDSPSRLAYFDYDTYCCGLALLLLACDVGPKAKAPRLTRSLCLGIDKRSGWWGYVTPGGGEEGRTVALPASPGLIPNISTSLFAVMGLHAACVLGVEPNSAVWARHARGLCAEQLQDGTWMYEPRRAYVGRKVVKEGYPLGTFIGIGNLLLAQRVLSASETKAAVSRLHMSRFIRRGLHALSELTPGAAREEQTVVLHGGAGATLRVPVHGFPLDDPGTGHYYTLLALSRAHAYASTSKDREDVPFQTTPWFESACRWLLRRQREDGGWSAAREGNPEQGSNLVDTSLAVLFLTGFPRQLPLP